MKHKDFDQWVKTRLEAPSDQSGGSDWEAFSEILKKSEGFESIDFDDSIRQKVKSHKVGFNESHWTLLKKRLEKEERLRKNVFSSKALELIVFFLVFLAFQTFQATRFQNLDVVVNSIKEGSIDHNIPPKVDLTQLETFVHSHLAYTQRPAVAVVDALPSSSSDRSLTLISDRPTARYSDLFDKSALTTLPTLSVRLANAVLSTPASLPLISKAQEQMKTKKYVMPVLSAGIGITQSGFDPIYNLKSYSTYSSQFAGGVMFCFQKNDIETITGFRYTRRTHEPAAIVEKYGAFLTNYYDISLDKIGYDIVELPLGVKYHFKKGKKTSWYLKSGISANLTLANHYTITNKLSGYQPLTPNNVGYVSEKDNKSFSSRLSEKEFNPGLLQGGKLSENWFVTVSAELGFERKLNENHSLVMGAEFNKFYMIDGIGPNKDKLNGFAINVGLKKLIN
ncbi:MAG: hypothetical protein IPH36_07955 [Saprospiraceae bacterium]|nr:hypothetical protein [Saprospiraceae bacterium]MBK7787479.1 hypothetical protein [Saprospiraceae bacterium]